MPPGQSGSANLSDHGKVKHTDGNVHLVRRDCYDRPNHQQHLPDSRHNLPSQQIRECTNERTKSGIRNQVTDDEPDVSVVTTDVVVNC